MFKTEISMINMCSKESTTNKIYIKITLSTLHRGVFSRNSTERGCYFFNNGAMIRV